MKNTVNKGILFYLLLLCSVVVGVGCIILSVLILSPGTEVFGISYYGKKVDSSFMRTEINNNSSEFIDDCVKNGTISTIIFKTDYVDIDIITKDIAKMEVKLDSTTSGLIKKNSRKKFKWGCTHDKTQKTLTIEVYGPECMLFFSKNATIKFFIPKNYNKTDLSLAVETNSGNIIIGDNLQNDISFKSLNVKSTKSTSLQLGRKAKFTGDVNVNIPEGNISIYSQINSPNVNITSESAKIILNDITVSSNLTLKTNSSIVKINKLNGKLIYDARKGVFDAEEINGDLTCSEEVLIANIFIDKLNGAVLLPNADTSNITINNLGNIFSPSKISKIKTSSGNVEIKHLYTSAYIQTANGRIDVVLTSNQNCSVVELSTVSGNINANFNNLNNEYKIMTKSGTVNVNFKSNLQFNLTYNCNEHAPTLSPGLSSGEIKNNASFAVGSPKFTDVVTINNNEGKTTINDDYIMPEEEIA